MTRVLSSPSIESPGRIALAGALILVLVLLGYWPAIHGEFIGDDAIYITHEPLIRSPDGIWQFWISTEPVDFYPVTFGLFWIEWRLWGENPTGYHVLNLLLHTVASVLVWRVLRELSVPGAYVAALLFAIHPFNVQSVAWIASRKNILSLIFAAWATLWYLRSSDREGGWWRYWAALVIMALGLLSKMSILPLPAVLLLCDWWKHGCGTIRRRDIVRTLPFFALAGAMTIFTLWYQHAHRAFETEVRGDSFLSRLGGAGWVIWFYLIKVFAPVNLMYGYPAWPVSISQPVLYFAPLVPLVLAFVFLWRVKTTWAKAASFALTYFVLMLIPVTGLVNTGFFRYSLVADHYVYYSSIGIIALATAGAQMFIRRVMAGRAGPSAAFAASAVVAALLLALTLRRSVVWSTEASLWSDTFTRNPAAWYAHNNYGLVMLREGKPEDAAQHFRRSLALNSRNDQAYLNLGRYHEQRNEPAEAVSVYRRGLEVTPRSALLVYNLGQALQAQGQVDEALATYARALELDPRDAQSHNNLSAILLQRGQIDDAIVHARQAIALRPGSASARVNLSNALIAQSKFDEAMQNLTEARRLEPDNPKVCNAMGIVLAHHGKLNDAIAEFQRALELQPDFAQARQNLAAAQKAGLND